MVLTARFMLNLRELYYARCAYASEAGLHTITCAELRIMEGFVYPPGDAFGESVTLRDLSSNGLHGLGSTVREATEGSRC
jgi:hypothetical protein